MPEKKPAPCAEGCKEFIRLGTNHLQGRKTCLTCGHYTTYEIEPPEATFSPRSCPHEITDRRGSTKSEVQTFCKQCNTCIDSRPRSEYERAKSTAKKIQTASTHVVDLAPKLMREQTLSKSQMDYIDSQFRAMAMSHFNHKDDITPTQLKAMLDDAIDSAVVRQSAAASAMKACLTAYIAPKKPFDGVLCTDNLPFVDIFKNKGIWVCLDEGCNSN